MSLLFYAFLFYKLSIIWAQQDPLELVGYDCGQELTNYSIYSLVDVGECDARDDLKITTHVVEGTLLQRNDYTSTHAISCKVEVHRRVFLCHDGWFSTHTKPISGSDIKFLKELTRDQCSYAHKTKILNLDQHHTFDSLKPNQTTSMPVTFAGTLTHAEGSCEGAHYRDPFGWWDKVVAVGHIHVTLVDYDISVHLSSNTVILPSGVRCPLNADACIDLDGSTIYWDHVPTENCGVNKYSILYEGLMNKTTETDKEDHVMYTVETPDAVFAFSDLGKTPVCSHNFIATEHPKLFIVENEGRRLEFEQKISTENVDLMAYVNSKLLFVETHFKRQLRSMYLDLIQQKCQLERKVIANTLSTAASNPDDFAYRLTGRPGFVAVTSGEVAYLSRCHPVPVTQRETEGCYNEIPVLKHGKEAFLMAKTRILTHIGVKAACDPHYPPMYKINGVWIKLNPHRNLVHNTPTVLKPELNGKFKYDKMKYTMSGGLYDQATINRLKERTMFSIIKPAVLTSLALGLLGYNNDTNEGLSVIPFISKGYLENLVTSFWYKIWGNFEIFGTTTAGFLGVFFIGKIIKYLIDTFIRGFSLHESFGCTLPILGSFWGEVSQFLLHWGRNNDTKYSRKPAKPKHDAPTADGKPEQLDQETDRVEIPETITDQATAPTTYTAIYPGLPFAKHLPSTMDFQATNATHENRESFQIGHDTLPRPYTTNHLPYRSTAI